MRISLCTAALVPLLLAGCSQIEVKENLGLTRKAPDEFRVVSRPPLSVPKEFFLTPPSIGQDRAFGRSAEAEARDLVTGGRSAEDSLSAPERESSLADTAAPIVSSSPLASSAEESLLRRAGAASADPDIREKLYEENARAAANEPGMLERLRGEGDGDPLVDAKAEKDRLEKNKNAGKPVNTGDVPVVDPKKKSTLERLF